MISCRLLYTRAQEDQASADAVGRLTLCYERINRRRVPVTRAVLILRCRIQPRRYCTSLVLHSEASVRSRSTTHPTSSTPSTS